MSLMDKVYIDRLPNKYSPIEAYNDFSAWMEAEILEKYSSKIDMKALDKTIETVVTQRYSGRYDGIHYENTDYYQKADEYVIFWDKVSEVCEILEQVQ